jgi:hypothetical protein
MNCDQVFDVLTRGPFPTGAASDTAVQRHLAACGECRQLAEALRPALDLIHESVPPEESWGLPGYWDDSTAPLETSDLKAGIPSGADQTLAAGRTRVQPRRLSVRPARVVKERSKRKKSSKPRIVRHYLLATAAGVAAAVIVFAMQPATRSGSTIAAAALPIAWPPQQPCKFKLDPNASAFPPSAKDLAHQLTNCTACHTAGQRHWLMQSPTLAVSQTCLECHQFVAHQ